MHIHFLRNASFIIHTAQHHILVDPMLGARGHLPPLSFIRHSMRRNPLVDLPMNASEALETVTAGIITHCRFGHADHLDKAGAKFLATRQIPVYCNHLDEKYLQRQGLATIPLQLNQPQPFFDGTITPVKAVHGYGLMSKLMGSGMGYMVRLSNEPSVYISGDTVLTDVVRDVLRQEKPDIAVVAAGGASLDVGRPILMPMSELLEFVRLAPRKVMAMHLEALNHCPITRTELQTALAQAHLSDKVLIPSDGEVLDASALELISFKRFLVKTE